MYNLKVVQTWGMTEVTCSCLHVPGGRDDRSGSVGYIDPNTKMKLINDQGKEVTVKILKHNEKGNGHYSNGEKFFFTNSYTSIFYSL